MASRVQDTRPLAVRVYERMASEIVDGTLKPGTALIQEHVAAQYGVSRTPVRDALTQVTLEGLASLVPGSGYVVNELTSQDVSNVFEVRYALEELAVRQAIGHHTPKQLVRLRALIDEFETIDPDDAEEQFQLGKDFHLALVGPCPNRYLRETLENIWAHPIQRRITRAYEIGPRHQAEIATAHRQILAALQSGDIDLIIRVLGYCHDSGDVTAYAQVVDSTNAATQ
ncbi:GntR family transcriptional regulator [Paeniglutamicibacter cryotolerans]|uniref:DNA-binding GntR family transcriptional regulator n=1 Tax=Paeniglutamicibacter cryotolerans TaxID=670079 RepID=A0A839QHY1_9MICC|nr:GntR family transcriptional regulator [Paeniglutamicibacter cryotolerans]MBB2994354.1 DNA-binding GntR family transcriptional regulator [Paeniglutamicibacter cryotolerans]